MLELHLSPASMLATRHASAQLEFHVLSDTSSSALTLFLIQASMQLCAGMMGLAPATLARVRLLVMRAMSSWHQPASLRLDRQSLLMERFPGGIRMLMEASALANQ